MPSRSGRVQVQDLAPPEPIRPAPVQSDTFAAPAPPPIDNNLERLAQGLGTFNDSLRGYARATELNDKKEQTAQRLEEFNAWVASTQPSDQLAMIHAGRMPWHNDPYIGAVFRRHYGGLMADNLAATLDTERLAGNIPIGRSDFNPQAFLLERSQGIVENLRGNREAVGAFREGLDKIRVSLGRMHTEATASLLAQRMDSVASDNLSRAFDTAHSAQSDPQSMMAAVREVYRDLGPRMRGGSLDLQYNHLDTLLMEVLAEKAKNPATALAAAQMTRQVRETMEGGQRIGSLNDVRDNRAAVTAIVATATRTLGTAREEAIRAEVLQNDVRLAERTDGSFANIEPATVPNEILGTDVRFEAEARRKAAIEAALHRTRQAGGGFNEEFNLTVNNGVKHPTWFSQLESAYASANTNVGNPEQLDQLQKAATLYNTLADRNHSYVRNHLTKEAREFFETYSVLTRELGMEPGAASAATARVFSSETNRIDPAVERLQREKVNTAVAGLDFSWWPFAGGVVNRGHMEAHIGNLANTLVRATGMDPAQAVKTAAQRVQDTAVNVNGHAVFGSGLNKDDGQHVTPLLESVFNKNPDRFRELGITAAADLSILPFRQDVFVVVNARTGLPVQVPVREVPEDPNSFQRIAPQIIRASQIQQVRAAQTAQQRADAAERIMQMHQAQPDPMLESIDSTPGFNPPRETRPTPITPPPRGPSPFNPGTYR